MKETILAAALLLPIASRAQSIVQYTYDNAGNRTSQTIPSDRRNETIGNQQDNTRERTVDGIIDDHVVRVVSLYGQRRVRVEILGLESSDECVLSVYTISGRLIVNQGIRDLQTTIDLSSYRPGIYILKVCLNGEFANWKMINK